MDELNKRVMEIMDYSGLSKSDFAAILDISLPVLTHLSSGRNKPSLDIITKILSNYNEIDVQWLLFGEGQMIKKAQKAVNLDTELNKIEEQLQKLDDINTQLQQVINYHTIFLNEVNYLSQLSNLVKNQQFEASKIKAEIEQLTNSIKSKL